MTGKPGLGHWALSSLRWDWKKQRRGGQRQEEHQKSHCGHGQSETPPAHSDAKGLEAAENTSGVRITVNLGTSGSNVCVERLEHTKKDDSAGVPCFMRFPDIAFSSMSGTDPPPAKRLRPAKGSDDGEHFFFLAI